MFEIIYSLLWSVVLFLIFRWLRKVSKEDHYANSVEVYGVIDKIVYTRNKNTEYHVLFETLNGDKVKGESIPYVVTKGKYSKGDTVKIKYFINKNGDAFVKIIDDSLKPCKVGGFPWVVFGLSILFLMVSLYKVYQYMM